MGLHSFKQDLKDYQNFWGSQRYILSILPVTLKAGLILSQRFQVSDPPLAAGSTSLIHKETS
jgi:hypothetical protein